MAYKNVLKMSGVLAMLILFTSILAAAAPQPDYDFELPNLPTEDPESHLAEIQRFTDGTEYIQLYNGHLYILPNLTALTSFAPTPTLAKRQSTIRPASYLYCNNYWDFKRVATSGIFAHIDAVCNTLKNRRITAGTVAYDLRTLNGVQMFWGFAIQQYNRYRTLTFSDCVAQARYMQEKCADQRTAPGGVRGFNGGLKVGADGEIYVWAEPEPW